MHDLLYFEDFPVGQTLQFGSQVLTPELIGSYAAAFDSLLGGLGQDGVPEGQAVASPWQLCALLMRINYDGWMYRTAARGAPGVDELRWHRRAAAGEMLFARYVVREARVSRSKPHLGLVQYHYDLLGDGDRPVLSQVNSVMVLLRSPAKDGCKASPDERPPEQARVAGSDVPPDRPPASRIRLGSAELSEADIIAFARTYDPQPFHVDPAAARIGPFGALAASGWHTAALWARAYADGVASRLAGLPRAADLLWVRPLRWQRPALAGRRLTFDLAPIGHEQAADGRTAVTALCRGLDPAGATMVEFTLGMAVAGPR